MLIDMDFNNVFITITSYNWYILQMENAGKPIPVCLGESSHGHSQNPSHFITQPAEPYTGTQWLEHLQQAAGQKGIEQNPVKTITVCCWI